MTQTALPAHFFALPHLVTWRKKRFLSQRELAILAGVTRHTVFFLEHGRSARYFTVRALALALNITPDELIEVDPNNNEKCRCGRHFSDCDYPDCR